MIRSCFNFQDINIQEFMASTHEKGGLGGRRSP